ncbi:MAG: bifunctional precorrin-2 dehydrogenase/sirohydrochlorin ferrochelatase [Nitrospirae bacterium]|nr:bifunctional precorrin-2 dehydrogenase/sirohydrochlorin ferrochelatase [Nitrospirota bacterium]
MEGVPVLVVGGGHVAERKIRALLRSGARVTVASPSLTPALEAHVRKGALRHQAGPFHPDLLPGHFLVIVATDDPAVNQEVARRAGGLVPLINVADPPEAGNVLLPSALTRGALCISISTGGFSPALARQIRREIATRYGEEYGRAVDLLAELRTRILQAVPEASRRQRLLQALAEADLPRLLREDPTEAAARARIAALLRQHRVSV